MHSARYADSDAARIERLLNELAEAGAHSGSARSAAFTAALALANPEGEVVLEVEGVCPGTILEAPRGSGGFGYDPVFLPVGSPLTAAEMASADKNAVSHRALALKALLALQPWTHC